MVRLECSRDSIGAVYHPETGDLVQLNEDHSRELAELVAAAHDHVWLAEAEEDPTCGVNGCGRTVDSPEDTCWQH